MNWNFSTDVPGSHRLRGTGARHPRRPAQARHQSVAVHPDQARARDEGGQGTRQAGRRSEEGQRGDQGGSGGLAKCKYTADRADHFDLRIEKSVFL